MEEMSRTFSVYTPRAVIGLGAVDNVATLARELSVKKALIVTDTGVVSAGLLEPVKESLQKDGIDFAIYDKCQPEAPLNVIEDCAKTVRQGAYDLIIAVGGGSVIDTAKVTGVLAVTDEDVRGFLGMDKVKKAGLPKILIPTTGGTGSEWSGVCVVTDNVDGQKKVIHSKYAWGEAAIIDPLMTLNLPTRLTGDTGMDALSHGIEAYTTWKANVISDMYAEKTIQLVAENLRIAYAKGAKHIEARYKIAIGAALSMQAFMSSAGGLVHSMNYPIGVKAHISHGAAVSIMLPYVMEYNLPGNPAKYGKIAQLMGEDITGLSKMDAARRSVEAVRKLSQDVGMPQKLREVGIKKEDIPGFVDYLFKFQLYGMENNARDLTREDAGKIFEAAW